MYRCIMTCFLMLALCSSLSCMSEEERQIRETWGSFSAAMSSHDAEAVCSMFSSNTNEFFSQVSSSVAYYYDNSLTTPQLVSGMMESVIWPSDLDIDSVAMRGTEAWVYTSRSTPGVINARFVPLALSCEGGTWRIEAAPLFAPALGLSDEDLQAFLDKEYQMPIGIRNTLDVSIVDISTQCPGSPARSWIDQYQASLLPGDTAWIRPDPGVTTICAEDENGDHYVLEGIYVTLLGGAYSISESNMRQGESINNPVPRGSWGTIETESVFSGNSFFHIRIDQVIRGEEAFNLLRSHNQFVQPAGDGQEYLILLLDVSYPDSAGNESSIDFIGFQRRLVVNNRIYDSDIDLILEPTLLDITLLPGGSASGYVRFTVPYGSQHPVLELGANLFSDEGGIYFEL